MHKLDQIKCLFNCNKCQAILEEPITLSCGNTVCKKHLQESLNVENVIGCSLCQKKHIVPEDGFLINKIIQNGLEIELNKLKLNPIFDSCKKALEDTKESAANVQKIRDNQEIYIKQYFDGIREQVESRQNSLKDQIDKYSAEIKQSIEKSESTCIQLAKEVNKLTYEIDKSNDELLKLQENFTTTLEINDEKFQDIKNNFDFLNSSFNQMLSNYEKSLLANEKCRFLYSEIEIGELVGKLIKEVDHAVCSKIVITPVLITPQLQSQHQNDSGNENRARSLRNKLVDDDDENVEPVETPKKAPILKVFFLHENIFLFSNI